MIKRIFIGVGMLFLMVSCEKTTTVPNEGLADRYVGNWSCQESSSLYGNSTYSVQISNVSVGETQKIQISNFYNDNLELVVNLLNMDLTIEQQSLGGYDVHGDGISYNNFQSIDLTYEVNDGVDNDVCSATFVKQ